MIEKSLDDIRVEDVLALSTSRRTEGRRLDFKSILPDAGEKAVRAFLADAAAMANTDGGDLIFGVEEDGNGTASAVTGVQIATLDADMRTIQPTTAPMGYDRDADGRLPERSVRLCSGYPGETGRAPSRALRMAGPRLQPVSQTTCASHAC